MTGFAGRCGIHDVPRESACQRVLQAIAEQRIERVRVAWCDLHGALRGKTLMAHAVDDALRDGIGMAKDIPIAESYRGVMPFLISDTLRTALLVAFPPISLWLVKFLN